MPSTEAAKDVSCTKRIVSGDTEENMGRSGGSEDRKFT
jgi:hypothetical protein